MNLVSITGVLKECDESTFRILEYDAPYTDKGCLETRRIKIKYWTFHDVTRVTLLPINTQVLIQGHLEEHEIFGTILLVEKLEVIGQK